ncbi:autoinducer synthase [Sphingobium sp. RSMS]|uniref:acyl-homoserine-lactone synthase n=1 Tax=Sphingobium sp. RSMS TaxID=520734 RepID=UPI0010F4B275|nr:acyl-homoserine-lactone synthase [Sphingobium sp. RSMS]UXC89761.1 autoinducer synthase [Sphingobium sp. RSMS]
MLHIVKEPFRPLPDTVLRAMFAARKSVFVDLLKWQIPVLDGRFEVDQFDDEHARYIILSEPDGTHLASARLLPTQRPHILDSFYARLCDAPPPRGGDIFEITRFCLDRNLRAAERRVVRNRLVTAIAEHALENRISRYVAIAEMNWFQQILAFGWQCRPLGAPQWHEGSLLVALEIEMRADTLDRLAEAGIYDQAPMAA